MNILENLMESECGAGNKHYIRDFTISVILISIVITALVITTL